MPAALTPSSSAEIICISPPPLRTTSTNVGTKRKRASGGSSLRPPLSVKTNVSSSSFRSTPHSHRDGAERYASPSYTNKGKGVLSIHSRTNEVIVLDDEEPAPLAINVADQWDPSAATTLPRPRGFSPSIELKDQAYRARNAYDAKEALQTGKRKIRKEDVKKAGEEMLERGREAVTAKMVGIIYERIVHGYKEAERKMSTLGKDSNPITNSDLYTRTDHFVSAATGHQVSNRGGGSSGAATYWSVRTAKMEEQAREKVCLCLSGHGPGHREYTFGGVSPRCYSY